MERKVVAMSVFHSLGGEENGSSEETIEATLSMIDLSTAEDVTLSEVVKGKNTIIG